MGRFVHLRNLLPLAGGLALAAATACGSDDNGAVDADVDVDADVSDDPDAEAPDAEVEEDDVEGVISVTETLPFPPPAESPAGASIDINFFEPGTGDGTVAHTDGQVGCTVTTFADGEAGPPRHSEGPVDITGTQIGHDDDGFGCEFDDELDDYVCTITDGQATMSSHENCGDIDGVDCDSAFVIEGVDLTENFQLVGSHITVDGFNNDVLEDGPGPVIAVQSHEINDDPATVVELPGDAISINEDPTEDVDYAFTIGAEDPEQAFANLGADFAFLQPGVDTENLVTIVADQTSGAIDDIDVDIFPLGDGLELAQGTVTEGEGDDQEDIPYLQPFEFLGDPEHAELSEVRFSCADDVFDGDDGTGVGGTCHEGLDEGDIDDLDGDDALIVTGVAKNADAEAHFQCRAFENEVAVSADAIEAILGIEPDKVQTSVTYGTAVQLSGTDVSILVGHTRASDSENVLATLPGDD